MGNPVVDVESWPIEQLIAAVMTLGIGRGSDRIATAMHARDVAVDLLADMGGISGLARSTTAELEARLSEATGLRVPAGAGARAIAAAFELGRRAATEASPPTSIASSGDVARWAAARLGGLDHEELWLLALDGRSRLRAVRCVAKGGLHGVGVRPSDPLRLALRAAASGFVLVHNHPSGDPTPSVEDVTFTHRVAAAAATVGMPLLDHVVVARGGFASVPLLPAPSPSARGEVELSSRRVDA